MLTIVLFTAAHGKAYVVLLSRHVTEFKNRTERQCDILNQTAEHKTKLKNKSVVRLRYASHISPQNQNNKKAYFAYEAIHVLIVPTK